MRISVRKIGNSSGVILPKPFLKEIGALTDEEVDIQVEAGRIVIAPLAPHPRAGWDEASRLIAEAGDDALVWPEFANEFDHSDWKW